MLESRSWIQSYEDAICLTAVGAVVGGAVVVGVVVSEMVWSFVVVVAAAVDIESSDARHQNRIYICYQTSS